MADTLASDGSSEAELRTAVGRAYGAAFLFARDMLGVQGRTHIHGRVIGELHRYDRLASRQLDALMNLRSVADYDLEVRDPLRTDWQRNYQMARSLANFELERLR